MLPLDSGEVSLIQLGEMLWNIVASYRSREHPKNFEKLLSVSQVSKNIDPRQIDSWGVQTNL